MACTTLVWILTCGWTKAAQQIRSNNLHGADVFVRKFFCFVPPSSLGMCTFINIKYKAKLIVPTRNTRFLPNLTLEWLTTATRSTRGARRTFHSANLQESTTPCSIHGVSGNSPLNSWAWVGWGRLCLKSTTYILLSRPNHHQGYELTETLCFQRDKHPAKL